jgi:hypothetical protein
MKCGFLVSHDHCTQPGILCGIWIPIMFIMPSYDEFATCFPISGTNGSRDMYVPRLLHILGKEFRTFLKSFAFDAHPEKIPNEEKKT